MVLATPLLAQVIPKGPWKVDVRGLKSAGVWVLLGLTVLQSNGHHGLLGNFSITTAVENRASLVMVTGHPGVRHHSHSESEMKELLLLSH